MNETKENSQGFNNDVMNLSVLSCCSLLCNTETGEVALFGQ